MKFVPRRDGWLGAVIWSSVLILVLSGLSPYFLDGPGPVGSAVLLISCLGFALFTAWLWVGTYYVMEESELVVRSGPMRQVIPYSRVKSASRVRSWAASAATSRRRIELYYNKYDVVHISPLDEDRFLYELKTRCPEARIE
ncbi:PH domain-containing protein [Paenibacillus tarimensis]